MNTSDPVPSITHLSCPTLLQCLHLSFPLSSAIRVPSHPSPPSATLPLSYFTTTAHHTPHIRLPATHSPTSPPSTSSVLFQSVRRVNNPFILCTIWAYISCVGLFNDFFMKTSVNMMLALWSLQSPLFWLSRFLLLKIENCQMAVLVIVTGGSDLKADKNVFACYAAPDKLR